VQILRYFVRAYNSGAAFVLTVETTAGPGGYDKSEKPKPRRICRFRLGRLVSRQRDKQRPSRLFDATPRAVIRFAVARRGIYTLKQKSEVRVTGAFIKRSDRKAAKIIPFAAPRQPAGWRVQQDFT